MRRSLLHITMVIIIILSFIIQMSIEPISVVQAQNLDSNSLICVASPPNTTKFPDVSLEIRAIDAHYQTITGITSSSIQVFDNGTAGNITKLTSNTNGLGADIYFVIDQGNRTDQTIIRDALMRYGEKFMIDGKDRVTIITNRADSKRANPLVYLPMTNSLTDFITAVNGLPTESDKEYRSAIGAFAEALNQLRGDTSGICTRPRLIVAIIADEELTNTEASTISDLAFKLRVPVNIAHVKRLDQYKDSAIYQKITEATNGIYEQVDTTRKNEFTELDPNIFTSIQNSRLSYSLQYRSSEGTSGSHTVIVQWVGQDQSTSTNSTEYQVNLTAPTLTFSSPIEGSVIERAATQKTENGFLYDIDTQSVELLIDWSDGYPRNLISAELLMQTALGTVTAASIAPSDLGRTAFDWDLREILTEGDNPITLQVRVIDELGLSATSQPVNLIIRNTIPSGLASSLADPLTRYILIGVGVLVLVLIILVIVYWKKVSKLASTGAIGQMVDKVRKTILGGVKRGKPVAMLKVLDGPGNLIGKELPIYTENVKLGRDPAQSDFTFFESTNSTISGLHARLEKIDGQWRLVAISKSGSETFLDDESIPMRQPVPIQNGQIIRLGYPAQQCVELEFQSSGFSENQGNPSSNNDNNQTEEKPKPRKTKTYTDEEGIDLPEMQKTKEDKEADFDDYFQSLRDR